MKIQNVFFDYGELIARHDFNDNTLIRAHTFALEYLNAQNGQIFTLEQLSNAHNSAIQLYLKAREDNTEWSMEKIMGVLCQRINAPLRHAKSFSDIYSKLDHDYSLISGAREALEITAQSHKLGIISNLPHNSLIYELHDFGLLDLFESITISGQVGYRKPHPAIYRAALANAFAKPEQSMFVSHDAEEVAGAERVGMKGVLVKSIKEVIGIL